MIVKAIGVSGGKTNGSKLTTFVVNNSLAIDAGSICSGMTIEQQLSIKNVVITHAHLDHIAELPFFLDNIAIANKKVNFYCTEETLAYIKKFIFNNNMWPDFSKIPNSEKPTVTYNVIQYGETYNVGKFKVTPIPVNHMKGSCGVLVENYEKSFIFTSDTGVTDKIWKIANENKNCKTIITECSFPKRLSKLAEISFHLDVNSLEQQIDKLNKDKKVFIYHLKPQLKQEITDELENLNVKILSDGDALEV